MKIKNKGVLLFMSELREKMKMDMELKGYSPRTIKNYIGHVSNFAKYYNKSPELLRETEIRQYLHYCITERKLREGTVNYINASLKFFYTKTLNRYWNMDKIFRIKEPRRLPCFWQAKNHALRNLIFPAPYFHYWVFMVECVKR